MSSIGTFDDIIVASRKKFEPKSLYGSSLDFVSNEKNGLGQMVELLDKPWEIILSLWLVFWW